MRWMTGLLASGGLLMLLTSPVAAGGTSQACDCSCPSYRALVGRIDAGEPAQDQVARCGPICAITWSRCEQQGPAPAANDAEEDRRAITLLLDKFLAGASSGDPGIHDRFWSEELVYTSSAGDRFGKPELMAELEQSPPDDAQRPAYSARDVRIRPFGDLILLDFTLVAESTPGQEQAFLNSGVFRREQGHWRVINWQATIKRPENAH